MLRRVGYFLRETASNLTRNVTITIASVITIAVSVALVGGAFVLRVGMDNATRFFQKGVEFIVFMKPDASDEQLAAMRRKLEENPLVERFVYVDHEEAYAEAKEILDPILLETLTPQDIPTSYRVVPTVKDSQTVRGLVEEFRDEPGVEAVEAATDALRKAEEFAYRLSVMVVVVAAFASVAAVLLILNTIRMAAFARRHEVEVMKLVGAGNWFVRIPFMLEGLAEGLAGAALGVGGVALAKPRLEGLFGGTEFPLLEGFHVGGSEAMAIYLLMVGMGAVVGAVGAGVAVTRFLDV
ncbi:MAG: hypothetical protein KatS3mg008_2074 [Acidimicrobiales bacterium]|nr:MAG: hypothetical protein KatS3mg008_2074 [Acidimicrobiales bacterium]